MNISEMEGIMSTKEKILDASKLNKAGRKR